MQKKHLGRMLCSFALSALTLWGVSVTTAAKDARAALRSLREESLGVMLLRYERGDGGEEYLSMQTSLALRAAPLLRGEDERIAQAWSTELTQKPDDGAAGPKDAACPCPAGQPGSARRPGCRCVPSGQRAGRAMRSLAIAPRGAGATAGGPGMGRGAVAYRQASRFPFQQQD